MNDLNRFPPPITVLVANFFLIDELSRGPGDHSYSSHKVPESVEAALGEYLTALVKKPALMSDIYSCCSEYWTHFLVDLRDRFVHQPITVRMGDRSNIVTFTERGDAFTLSVST